MYKVVKITERTKKILERSFLKRLSLNAVIDLAFGLVDCDSVFWRRRKPIPVDKRISIKIDETVYARIDEKWKEAKRFAAGLRKEIFVELMVEELLNPTPMTIASVNVKGYKAKPKELAARLVKLAGMLNEELPDVICLQEMKAGEDMEVVGAFERALAAKYKVVMPFGMKVDEAFNNCVCVMLVREQLAEQTKAFRLGGQADEWKYRYNLATIGDMHVLNVWVPQVFSTGAGAGAGKTGAGNTGTGGTAQQESAREMWAAILREVEKFERKAEMLLVVGDFNTGEGVFERELAAMREKMADTKSVEAAGRPTGEMNELDHAFVNYWAAQERRIVTDIMEPSVRRAGISDHEGLVVRIERRARLQ